MKGRKVFLILMIVFAVIAIGLAIWLGLVYRDRNQQKTQLENQYQQAYFVLLDETNAMEIKTAKLLATASAERQQEYLYDLWKSSEVSSNALASLASREGTVTNTMRFINQVGDFSKYLANQVSDGEKISKEHMASIDKIHDMLASLGKELNKIKDELIKGYLFMDNVNTNKDLLHTTFEKLNDASVKYPQLIYDGPFSEALQDRDPKGLKGDDITKEQGEEIIKKLVGKNVGKINFLGEWKGDIVTMNYETTYMSTHYNIQLAKKGGMPLAINAPRNVTNPQLSEEECVDMAEDFLEKCGFDNLDDVWICNDNSVYYINFAPIIDDIIYYPDLVKVKIASDNGQILGLEAINYALNHTSRNLSRPTLSESEARDRVSLKSGISEGRLALIPYKTNQEILTYEFSASHKGKYYIYIDAKTGEEVNILYVISTSNGDLLM